LIGNCFEVENVLIFGSVLNRKEIKKTSNKFAGNKKRVVCLQPLREKPERVEG